MENNKQKIAIVALVALLVVGAVGATIAYFTSETTFKNEFKTPAHESEFTEEFSSPENWLPGDEEKKEVSVKNTGEYDIAVRISYTEEWIGADGTTQLPLIQDQDGTEVRAAIINFPNKDDWGKRTEDDGVTYYYYKDILGKDESTSLFMDKVTFNKDIKHAEVCTNVYTYKDGTTSTGITPEDGKIVISTTKRCESTGQTYAGGTYILTIKIETIQWDQYKNGWGLDEDLKDLEWEKTLNSVMKKKAIIDNIKSEFVEAETGINFGKAASDTNGKGVYLRAGTENNEYPIYYYRGDVNDNNIIFAEHCWKIVRTTETGGIKLIYNGKKTSENTCNNTVPQIGTSAFNSEQNNAKYVGYTYDTSNTNSTIKNIIDSWYKKNILNKYDSYLEDTVWCNDRSVVLGPNTSDTYYGAYGRIVDNKLPSLECLLQSDKYTVKTTSSMYNASLNGNKILDYPIALLTVDEYSFAGGNSYNYLTTDTDDRYWLMSPGYIGKNSVGNSGTEARMFFYSGKGSLSHGLITSYVNGFVRPSVSLRLGIEVIYGDGTANNPYIVE